MHLYSEQYDAVRHENGYSRTEPCRVHCAWLVACSEAGELERLHATRFTTFCHLAAMWRCCCCCCICIYIVIAWWWRWSLHPVSQNAWTRVRFNIADKTASPCWRVKQRARQNAEMYWISWQGLWQTVYFLVPSLLSDTAVQHALDLQDGDGNYKPRIE